MPKQRVTSGVAGLDVLLGGGYLKGRTVLVAGGPGTGKSILTWHFMFSGIEAGEPAVLVSLDQSSKLIVDDMAELGWDARPAVDGGMLQILSGTFDLVPRESGYEYVIGFDHPLFREQPFTMSRLASLVRKSASELKATRIVVDGLGPLLELAGRRLEVRQMIYGFIRELAYDDATVLLTHELRSFSLADIDEMPYFICDTVIVLDTLYVSGDYIRTMRVMKMRGASHSMRPVIFKITDHGISVFPETRIPE